MKNTKQKELEGINIYLDKKGQKVYLDPFTKKGYVITPAKEKTFQMLNNIPLYVALVGVFCYVLFEFPWWVSLIAMAGSAALLTYRFYKFLGNCTTYASFKPEKKHQPTSYSSPDSIIYMKIVLFALLAILLVISVTAFTVENNSIFFGSIAIAIVCFAIAIKYLTIIIGRKRK